MLCDAHIHIGQFYDIYTSPEEIASFLYALNVDVVAISSTTTCEEKYDKVIEELRSFVKIFQGKAVPVLWVTPSLLKDASSLNAILLCGIPWKCIKVHPQLSPKEWDVRGENYHKVLNLARTLSLPVMIHTGVVDNCHPEQLQALFEYYNNHTFIMAHGRPLKETISVMKQCPNTYVDTAFMPTDDILSLIHEGFVKRILWGTDFPIIRFYERNINYFDYYNNTLIELKERTNFHNYQMITNTNMQTLYNF